MNLFKKIFNYLKILIFKKFYLKTNKDIKKKFKYIYKLNYWSDKESVSGAGSNKKNTENVSTSLDEIIKTYDIKNIYDAACGDFKWMKIILAKYPNMKYEGSDIVEELINKLKIENTSNNIKFSLRDVTKDPIPNSDLLICRDLFIHFSNEHIMDTIKNFLNSNTKYILASDSANKDLSNKKDIMTGEYRHINLQKEPFNFPEPKLYKFFDTFNFKNNTYETKMCLWDRKEIKIIYEK